MSLPAVDAKPIVHSKQLLSLAYVFRAIFAGILLSLSFAPFHMPGLAILSLAIIYGELQNKTLKHAAIIGFTFGAAFMGIGVSWVFVSINLYGNLNVFLSALVTCIFIMYLAAFYTFQALIFTFLQKNTNKILKSLLFAATWCLFEYLRANIATGFPWLLVGFGQIDSPLSGLLPFVGLHGVSLITCLAACILYYATQIRTVHNKKRALSSIPYLIIFLVLILAPSLLPDTRSQVTKKSIDVGVIQANLSMRDKWDDDVFAQITNRYFNGINDLKSKAPLIILPESAVPVPASYVSEFIGDLNLVSQKHNNSILMGIPHSANQDETLYYNTLTFFGNAKGTYFKQHLVPFGEYIPKPFRAITQALEIPDASMIKGVNNQKLLDFNGHPFASLICFEVAYPEILRKQLPKAQWIISVSDAGWFGKSLAIYQQLQMSQTLSAMSGRYQIVANNNGLSSIIDSKGKIINSLPAFSSGNLYGSIHPTIGATLWSVTGDMPYLYLCIVIIIIAFVTDRRYSYRSTLPR